ncbi:MAG: hypothetical protein H6659_02220 [Ardenticatenaceae bacterium]|nr:hypothetical protein [Ardenticatenaceae bacterium]
MIPSSIPTKTRKAVKRPFAETYILISLTAFALTVVITRVFLEMAGYPQVGNSVLHIAHAIWGGLLLFVAVLVTLVLANRWAFTLSAILSGIGIGLFIDEVGKFITQKNDYFFPPAAPLIYSLFLLLVLFFLLIRRDKQPNPRSSMYRVVLGLQEVLDNDLDPREREVLLKELDNGRSATEPHISQLANQLTTYLQSDLVPLIPHRPGLWARFNEWLQHTGKRLGQKNHRRLIVIITTVLGLQALFVILLVAILWLSPETTETALTEAMRAEAETFNLQSVIWTLVRLFLQVVVGLLYAFTLLRIRQGREEAGLDMAIFASLLSITALNLLTFYLDQFRALTSIFATFGLFLLLITYRAWYLQTAPDDKAV